MDEWLRIGCKQVQELLKCDPEYQKMLQDRLEAEQAYIAVMEKLSPEDRECVDNYIALCENLEYQRTHTAYRCGKMRR